MSMGRKNNQNFATIPTGKLKERLKQMCEKHGIRFHETEESYTSQSSFFDNDDLHVFGERPESWKASGQRTKRGLYVTAQGNHISSDANGACNILRKIAVPLGISLEKITVSCCQFLDRIYLWKRSKEQKHNVKVQQLAAEAIGAL